MPSGWSLAERLSRIFPKDLYIFARGDQMWRYTSNGRDVTTPVGLTYYAADIHHEDIERKDETGAQRIKVTMGTQLPVLESLQVVTTRPMFLGIHRYHPASGAMTRLAYGRVSMVSFDGVTAELELATSETQLEEQIPKRLFGRTCPWDTYGPECGLNWRDWANTATITAAFRSSVSIDDAGLKPDSSPVDDGWYNNGLLVVGNSVVHINKHTGLDLEIFGGLPPGVGVGDVVQIVAGDDFTYATCDTKFNHVTSVSGLSFFGFPWLPNNDPLKHQTKTTYT